MGYDTSATQKSKITRKSKAARCTAVLPEQKSVHATKSPQVILCVLPRALTRHGRKSASQNRCGFGFRQPVPAVVQRSRCISTTYTITFVPRDCKYSRRVLAYRALPYTIRAYRVLRYALSIIIYFPISRRGRPCEPRRSRQAPCRCR